MGKCNCDAGLANLQEPSCIVKPSVIRKFVFVNYFKDDGTVNGIDLNSPFEESDIDKKLTNDEKSERWFLSQEVSNFATERADPNNEVIDNVAYNTSQGTRNMTADFLESSPVLVKKIEANNCVALGVYLIDEDNGISGIVNRDGFMDPIRLEKNAFAKLVMATEASIFKVMLSTTWQKSVKDGDLRVLPFSDHQTNILNKRGLVDVKVAGVSVSDATTAVVSYATLDGSAKGSPFVGLQQSDFELRNETTQSTVAISGSLENPDGTYTLTFAAQTSSDLGIIKATKEAFEFEVANIVFQ